MLKWLSGLRNVITWIQILLDNEFVRLCILHGFVVDEVEIAVVDASDVSVEVPLLIVVVVDNSVIFVVVGLDSIVSVVVDVLVVVVVEIVVIGPVQDYDKIGYSLTILIGEL